MTLVQLALIAAVSLGVLVVGLAAIVPNVMDLPGRGPARPAAGVG